MRRLDLTGQRFGQLVAIKPGPKTSRRRTTWICQCDCGKQKIAETQSLKAGFVRSCGCYQEQHPSHLTHGKSHTKMYVTWSEIKRRCYNANSHEYKYYGARGIKMCDEWLEFEPFYEWAISNGYSDNLSIDRIDVDGSYEPSNCRWVDIEVQANNKRNNVTFAYNGKTQTIAQWAREYGLSYMTLFLRLHRRHWPIEKALNTPQRGEKQYGSSLHICA